MTTNPKPPKLTPPELEAFSIAEKYKRGTVIRMEDWVQRTGPGTVRSYPVAAEPKECAIVAQNGRCVAAIILADGSAVLLPLEEMHSVMYSLRLFSGMLISSKGEVFGGSALTVPLPIPDDFPLEPTS